MPANAIVFLLSDNQLDNWRYIDVDGGMAGRN
jgi:hypothetical protein